VPNPIQTTSNALNGQELKDAMKIKLERAIDEIPLLKVGNTFKNAIIEFGFSMRAFPSDVPVPDEIDLAFELNPPEISEEDKQTVEGLKNHTNKLIDLRDKIYEEFENEIEKYCLLVEKGETIKTKEKPDEVRIEAGLKLPILTEVDGRKVEVSLDSSELNLKTNSSGGQFGK
jgi:hypothetical protein